MSPPASDDTGYVFSGWFQGQGGTVLGMMPACGWAWRRGISGQGVNVPEPHWWGGQAEQTLQLWGTPGATAP